MAHNRRTLSPTTVSKADQNNPKKRRNKSEISASRRVAFLSFFFLIVAGLVTLVEFGLWAAGFDYRPVRSLIPHFVFAQDFLADQENFRLDPELFWRYRPNKTVLKQYRHPFEYVTNSLGFRGTEFSETKREGRLRIAFLGDSNTFGLHIPFEQTLGEQVSNQLERTGQKAESLNFGVMGYSSLQGLRLLEREVLRFRPDVIVFWFGINDTQPAETRDSSVRMPWIPLLQANQALSRLRTVQLLRWSLASLLRADEGKSESDDLQTRVSQAEFRTNISEVVRLCSERGIVAIVPDYPSLLFRKAESLNRIIPPAHRLGVLQVAGESELNFYNNRLVMSSEHRYVESEGRKLLVVGPKEKLVSQLSLLPLDELKKQWLTLFVWSQELEQINQAIPESVRLPVRGLLEKEEVARCFVDLSHLTAYGYGMVAKQIVSALQSGGLAKRGIGPLDR
ncbi:MAG: SGNH/GDSL hydrolase family protein [Acidobacteriota bacterium]